MRQRSPIAPPHAAAHGIAQRARAALDRLNLFTKAPDGSSFHGDGRSKVGGRRVRTHATNGGSGRGGHNRRSYEGPMTAQRERFRV